MNFRAFSWLKTPVFESRIRSSDSWFGKSCIKKKKLYLERSGVVHRLDKDTSGVMVVAKSASAMAELQRQFKARETDKEYLALVWGRHPVSPFEEKQAAAETGASNAACVPARV